MIQETFCPDFPTTEPDKFRSIETMIEKSKQNKKGGPSSALYFGRPELVLKPAFTREASSWASKNEKRLSF